jgi:hypothetical protein
MLETLKRMVLGEPSPKAPAADPAGDLQHIEQVIRDTEADLQEAQAAVEHFRAKLAEVDSRTLLDRPDAGDDADAGSWVQDLITAQEDCSRLSAALPYLEAERDEARLAVKRYELSTYLNLIDQQKREYADLATVLSSQLSSAADTAATMAGLAEAIARGRDKAYGLEVETVGAPTGISFEQTDVRALWVQALSKARSRQAVTTPALMPQGTTEAVVTTVVTPVTRPAAIDQFESDGHVWTISPTTEGVCQHRVGNKVSHCGDPGAYQATYQPPGEALRAWIFCEAHGQRWQSEHISLPSASVAERG